MIKNLWRNSQRDAASAREERRGELVLGSALDDERRRHRPRRRELGRRDEHVRVEAGHENGLEPDSNSEKEWRVFNNVCQTLSLSLRFVHTSLLSEKPKTHDREWSFVQDPRFFATLVKVLCVRKCRVAL